MTIPVMQYEILDAGQLAERWKVPKGWIRKWTQGSYTEDPIPHKSLGKYVRYEWDSPKLAEWWARRSRQNLLHSLAA
jgi:hypothetical protein